MQRVEEHYQLSILDNDLSGAIAITQDEKPDMAKAAQAMKPARYANTRADMCANSDSANTFHDTPLLVRAQDSWAQKAPAHRADEGGFSWYHRNFTDVATEEGVGVCLSAR